jgi:uncharacterized membrane protein
VASYRPSLLKESAVPVGSTGTFVFKIKATQPNGTYNEDFQLVAEHVTWITGTQFTLPITIGERYKAELTSVENNFTMATGEQKTIHLTYKNIGAATWTNTGDNFIALNVTNPAGRTSAFKDDTWNEYPYRPTRLEAPTVAPGQFGEFDFVIKAPATPGVYHEDFQAVAEHITWISGSAVTLNITVADKYRAEVTSFENNLTMQPGEQKTIHLTLKNLGSETWTNSGENFTALNVTNPAGRTSAFKDASWTEYPYRPTRLEPPSVAPGQFGEFDFVLKAPQQTGTYNEDFQAVVEHVTWIPGSAFTIHITVAAPYMVQILSTSPASPLTLQPGERKAITVSIQNIGSKTWSNTGTNFVALNVTNPPGHTSVFQDSTWNEYPYRPTRLDTATVAPGGTGVFNFYIQAPQKAGSYTETFQAVAEHVEWITGSQFQVNATVVNPYAAEFTAKSSSSISMAKSSTAAAWIDAKNTGSATWKSGTITLIPNGPVGRTSAFQDSSWPSSSVVYKLSQDVAPGQTVRIPFTLRSGTTTGSFSESYQLQSSSGNMVAGSSFTMSIQVKPQYLGEIVSKTATNLDFKYGDQKTFTVVIKNTGMGTWTNTGPNFVSLNTVAPAGRQSIFRDGTWPLTTRPTLLDSPSSVAPGANGTFTFSLTAPSTTTNTTETFQLNAENITWIPGTTFSFTTSITPIKTEALLHVGIYSKLPASNEYIQVTANGPFYAKNGDSGTTHKQFAADEVVTVKYEGGRYHVTGPGLDVLSDSFVRFVPGNANTILRFSNYSATVSWDNTVNDNKFRGNLIAKFAPATNKLWGINEIYMEDYIRGIAEQSDGTHTTHLQTMSVVERTYAEYIFESGGKHANEGFDLNNTSGDQVYKGYGFETRSPHVAAAATATKGQMVSKYGNVVVTPYFSRSDGRTRSWNEVWAGNQDHCVSVPDPWSAPGPKSGHGVGLSAYGALQQAYAGKTYKEILHYYYTGVSIIDYY